MRSTDRGAVRNDRRSRARRDAADRRGRGGRSAGRDPLRADAQERDTLPRLRLLRATRSGGGSARPAVPCASARRSAVVPFRRRSNTQHCRQGGRSDGADGGRRDVSPIPRGPLSTGQHSVTLARPEPRGTGDRNRFKVEPLRRRRRAPQGVLLQKPRSVTQRVSPAVGASEYSSRGDRLRASDRGRGRRRFPPRYSIPKDRSAPGKLAISWMWAVTIEASWPVCSRSTQIRLMPSTCAACIS